MLRRLLKKLLPEPPAGARFAEPQHWRVPPQRDAAVWLRALPVLLPGGATLYLEGTTESQGAAWLAEHAIPEKLHIAAGTIWPKSDVYHIPLTPEMLESLAALVDRFGIACPAIHVHVHDDAQILLEWHDAFSADPMYVSTSIPEERVAAFAAALGVGPPLLEPHT
jgi:hypothetical protein